jgi:hypothetical protein
MPLGERYKPDRARIIHSTMLIRRTCAFHCPVRLEPVCSQTAVSAGKCTSGSWMTAGIGDSPVLGYEEDGTPLRDVPCR